MSAPANNLKVVVAALAGNALIAVSKFVAAFISGSAGTLAGLTRYFRRAAPHVAMVLADPVLRARWEDEVSEMRGRIQDLKRGLEGILTMLSSEPGRGATAAATADFALDPEPKPVKKRKKNGT